MENLILLERNEANAEVILNATTKHRFAKSPMKKNNPKGIIKTHTFKKTTDGWNLCD